MHSGVDIQGAFAEAVLSRDRQRRGHVRVCEGSRDQVTLHNMGSIVWVLPRCPDIQLHLRTAGLLETPHTM